MAEKGIVNLLVVLRRHLLTGRKRVAAREQGNMNIEQLIFRTLNHGDWNERASALRELARINDPRVLDVLLGAATDQNSDVRKVAIEELKWRDDPRIPDALLLAARDESWVVRCVAFEALGQHDDPRILDALLVTAKEVHQAIECAWWDWVEAWQSESCQPDRGIPGHLKDQFEQVERYGLCQFRLGGKTDPSEDRKSFDIEFARFQAQCNRVFAGWDKLDLTYVGQLRFLWQYYPHDIVIGRCYASALASCRPKKAWSSLLEQSRRFWTHIGPEPALHSTEAAVRSHIENYLKTIEAEIRNRLQCLFDGFGHDPEIRLSLAIALAWGAGENLSQEEGVLLLGRLEELLRTEPFDQHDKAYVSKIIRGVIAEGLELPPGYVRSMYESMNARLEPEANEVDLDSDADSLAKVLDDIDLDDISDVLAILLEDEPDSGGDRAKEEIHAKNSVVDPDAISLQYFSEDEDGHLEPCVSLEQAEMDKFCDGLHEPKWLLVPFKFVPGDPDGFPPEFDEEGALYDLVSDKCTWIFDCDKPRDMDDARLLWHAIEIFDPHPNDIEYLNKFLTTPRLPDAWRHLALARLSRLYQDLENYGSAIRGYEQIVRIENLPHELHLEALTELEDIYERLEEPGQVKAVRNAIDQLTGDTERGD